MSGNAQVTSPTYVEPAELRGDGELQQLVETLCSRHGDSVAAILFYGSNLRGGDLFEGVVDLYLLVDNYKSFYSKRWQAAANWLLPPNVFYLEVPIDDKILRAKYAVISLHDLRNGASDRWFHSYIWARFAQPVAIAYCRNTSISAALSVTFTSAVRTFLNRTLPRVPESGLVNDVWQRGFQLTYAAELRSEQSGRGTELTNAAQEWYAEATRRVARSLRHELRLEERDNALYYRCHASVISRLLSRITWPLRMLQGKLLSIARLLKALFTFDNGLDYLAWKLQRHSGQTIDVPQRVRRYPLIFIWGFGWRLYRRGVFR